MNVIVKDPGDEPELINIKDRFFEKMIGSVVGRRYERIDFGNGIVLIVMKEVERAFQPENFCFKRDGENVDIRGPVVFASISNSEVTGLEDSQIRIIKGCFGMNDSAPSAKDIQNEIVSFLSLIYEGREDEIFARKNAVLERRVVDARFMRPENIPKEVVPDADGEMTGDDQQQDVDISVYIDMDNAATVDMGREADESEYKEKHAAQSGDLCPHDDDDIEVLEEATSEAADLEDEPEEISAEVMQDAEALGEEGDGSDTETVADEEDTADETEISVDESDEDSPATYEGWFTSHLVSVDDDMSEKTRQQIRDVMVDKFRTLMSNNLAFATFVAEHLDNDMSEDESNDFFNFIMGQLIKRGGVKEEYAKRHPDEFVEDDRS